MTWDDVDPAGAHALSVLDAAARFEVDPAVGLTAPAAAARLAVAGRNELDEPERTSVWKALFEAMSEPFVVLLAAAGIGAVLLGEVRDGLFVLGGLVPIVGADLVTTFRSERALEALQAAAAPRANVLRDGRDVEIPAAEVVPGDVVLLNAGDVVPADARVLATSGLLLDRSVLTGESVPEAVSATPTRDQRHCSSAARRHMPARASSKDAVGRWSSRPARTPSSARSPAALGARTGADRRCNVSWTVSCASCSSPPRH